MIELEKYVMSHIESPYLITKITGFSEDRGNRVVSLWRELFTDIVTQFRDGYVISDIEEPTITIKKMFYPRWWLEEVGFFSGGVNKQAEILFSPNAGSVPHESRWQLDFTLICVCILIGFTLGMNFSSLKVNMMRRYRSSGVALRDEERNTLL